MKKTWFSWQNWYPYSRLTLLKLKPSTIKRSYTWMSLHPKVSHLRRRCCISTWRVFNGSSTIITEELSTGDGIIPIIMLLWFLISMKTLSKTFSAVRSPLTSSWLMRTVPKSTSHTPPSSSFSRSCQSRVSACCPLLMVRSQRMS